jgi:LPS sulfotransferase NodH
MSSLPRFLKESIAPGYLPDNTTPFVIVFLARTGSNFLASMLDSHPQVLCHHEVFNEDSIHRSLRFKGTPLSFGSTAERDQDPWAFLKRLYAFTDGRDAVGFKIAPRQNDRALMALLLNRRIRKVILGRQGWLHAYSSALIAERTQVWSRHKDGVQSEPPRETEKITVDPRTFRRFVQKRRAFYSLVDLLLFTTAQTAFRMTYEDIGKPQVMQDLLRFLGVDPSAQLIAKTDKQNSPRLADRIENLNELQAWFRGTKYEWMTTDAGDYQPQPGSPR